MHNFKLFIAGVGLPNSKRVIRDVQDMLVIYLEFNHHLEIIDVIDHPEVTQVCGVFATPTLVYGIKNQKRVFGSLRDHKKVLKSLGVLLDK